ncbi:MAG: VOC family protein [Acidimicrobiales bacterium]
MSAAPYFHVGIVVRDLAAAQRSLSEQLGVRWGPILRLDVTEVRDGDGNDLLLPTAICYSIEAPHLELIEEVPGSVWTCNEHSNLHHIGRWHDDLPTESARLASIGCPLQLCGRAGADAPTQFAYHGTDLGIRVEVLDASVAPMMTFLFDPPDA